MSSRISACRRSLFDATGRVVFDALGQERKGVGRIGSLVQLSSAAFGVANVELEDGRSAVAAFVVVLDELEQRIAAHFVNEAVVAPVGLACVVFHAKVINIMARREDTTLVCWLTMISAIKSAFLQ